MLAKTFPGFINFIGVKRKRCGSCNGCMATDCGGCGNCRDKKKFGGAGKKKQCCLKRRCVNMFSSGILFCYQSLLYLNINLPDLGTTIEQSPAELALPKVSKEQFERVCSLWVMFY